MSLFCRECAGEFETAKALYWHYVKEEDWGTDAAFAEVGREIESERRERSSGRWEQAAENDRTWTKMVAGNPPKGTRYFDGQRIRRY